MKQAHYRKKGEVAPEILCRYEKLREILQSMGRVLIAFSGGVDSTFLLDVAHDVLGDNVLAVIARSETYPQRERAEALKLARRMGVRYRFIETKELSNPDFSSNPPDRCYFCKKELFSKLKEIAAAEEIPHVLDGSNRDDTADFRPGSRAADELGIRSPLKEALLGKEEIRQLSKMLGLPTWNKPSMACLSSRFPYYSEIDSESLKRVEKAEMFLRNLGFSQVRVRHHGQTARMEIDIKEFPKIVEEKIREKIVRSFRKLGYVYVTLDLAGFRSGSMNEPLLLGKDKMEHGLVRSKSR